MASLFLFGADFPVAADGTVGTTALPGVAFPTWKVKLDTAGAALKIEAELTIGPSTVYVVATVDVTAAGAQWRLKDGPVAGYSFYSVRQDGLLDRSLAVVAGPLNLLGDATVQGSMAVINANLAMCFAGQNQAWVLRPSQLPLEIGTGDGHAALDLVNLALSCEADFLAAKTYNVISARGGRAIVFPRQHSSRAFVVPLAQTLQQSRLDFLPVDAGAGTLPLNADVADRGSPTSRTNPIKVPLEATAYRLRTQLVPGSQGSARLAEVTLLSEDGLRGPALRFHGIATSRNAPLSLSLAAALPLAMRAHSGFLSGAFHISPTLPNGIAVEIPQPFGLPLVHGSPAKACVDLGDKVALGCHHRVDHQPLGNADPPVAANLLADMTMPWLRSSSPLLHHPKAGDAYLPPQQNAGTVDRWTFSDGDVALPALTPELLEHAVGTAPDDRNVHHTWLNGVAATLRHDLGVAVHDTALREKSADNVAMRIAQMFPTATASVPMPNAQVNDDASAGLQPADYNVERDYGVVKVTIRIPGQKPPDYLVIPKTIDSGTLDTILGPYAKVFPIDGADFPNLKIAFPPSPVADPGLNLPYAILKLSRRYSLAEIFALEGFGGQVANLGGVDFLEDVVDSDVRSQAWLGLVIFNLTFRFEDDPVLSHLLPDKDESGDPALRFRYFALTPSKDSANPLARSSMNARIWYINDSVTKPSSGTDPQESTYRFEYVDAQWRDSVLARFDAGGRMCFRSMLGMQHRNYPNDDPVSWNVVKLRGRLERPPLGSNEHPRIRFRGEFGDKLPLLDDSGDNALLGVIKQIWFKAAEVVVDEGSGARVDFDGDIELKTLSLGDGLDLDKYITTEKGRIINFEKLGLSLPAAPKLDYSWLEIRYPSLKLNLNLPHFHLFGIPQLSLAISKLGIAWDPGTVDWSNSLNLFTGADWGNAKRIFLIDLRLTVGDLPEFAGKLFDKLNFDFSLALGQGSGGAGGLFRFSKNYFMAGLSAFGFENFNLDIARIISLHVGKVALSTHTYKNLPGQQVPTIELDDIELKVVGETIIPGLTLVMYALPDGRRALLCYLQGQSPKTNKNLLDIPWILIGQNLSISDTLAKSLLAIDVNADSTTPDLGKLVSDAISSEDIYPVAADAPMSPWLFGAGLSILNDFLAGKFLFQDRHYYGMMLRGKLFEEWLGYKFAISVVYIRRDRSEEDSFVISFTIPAVQVGSIRFTGGVVSIEIAANGNFQLDIGFPWLTPSGLRAWDRTLGAIVTPFQGSGGLYVGYQRTKFYQAPGNASDIAIFKAGFALQAGLGATFGGGIFVVWVRAGLYVIAEGSIRLNLTAKSVEGLRLVGAVGILVEGHGSLNWWIISADIAVIAQAEARSTLIWHIDPENPAVVVPGDKLLMQLDFSLTASASASACIGSGWFKVCQGISTSISMPFHQQVLIG